MNATFSSAVSVGQMKKLKYKAQVLAPKGSLHPLRRR